MPKSVEEGLKIVMAVSQVELQESRKQVFYLDIEGRRSGTTDSPQYVARRKASARMPAQRTASGQSQRQNRKRCTRNV